MKTKHAFFLRLIGSLFALVLLAAPSLGVALTITQVSVVVGGAVYCDTSVAQPVVCATPIWNLGPGGVTLTSGQTLILTQAGTTNLPTSHGGEDFDTSDRGGTTSGALLACSTAGGTPCTVQIYINGVQVVNDASGNANPLTADNAEPTSDPGAVVNTLFQEDETWVSAPGFSGTGYTLDLGYADNIHGGACAGGVATGCFPQHDWCSSAGGLPTTSCPNAATFFLGAGIGPIGNCLPSNTFGPITHPQTDSAGNTVGCYDSGALRITATALPHLTVLKTPKTGTFASGSQLTYTVVVTNNGDTGSTAHNVQLNDVLPGNGGLVWQTATPSQGTCTNPIASNTLHCDLGDIAAGGSVTVTITSTATTPAAACQDQPNPAANATDNEGDSATDSGDQKCTPPVNLTTVTQGGWHSTPHGNNPGTILNAYFAAHPGYSPKIGDITNACGGKVVTFTSANAIRAFLPAGGTPGVLGASATNPTSTAAGVFAGQVLALTLNTQVLSTGSSLLSYVITAGPATGKTVAQVLADADKALGGCGLPSYVTTISQLNDVVTYINELFD